MRLYGIKIASHFLLWQGDKVRRRNEWNKWLLSTGVVTSDPGSSSSSSAPENVLTTSLQEVSLDDAAAHRNGDVDAREGHLEMATSQLSEESTSQSGLANEDNAEEAHSNSLWHVLRQNFCTTKVWLFIFAYAPDMLLDVVFFLTCTMFLYAAQGERWWSICDLSDTRRNLRRIRSWHSLSYYMDNWLFLSSSLVDFWKPPVQERRFKVHIPQYTGITKTKNIGLVSCPTWEWSSAWFWLILAMPLEYRYDMCSLIFEYSLY